LPDIEIAGDAELALDFGRMHLLPASYQTEGHRWKTVFTAIWVHSFLQTWRSILTVGFGES